MTTFICSVNALSSPRCFNKTRIAEKINSSHTVWNSSFWKAVEVWPLGACTGLWLFSCALTELCCRPVQSGPPPPAWEPSHSAHPWLFPPSPPATAPQQEADSEVNTETLNKSSQGSSSSTQAAPSDTASASKEKEPSAEKSKDSGSVSIRRPLAGDSNPLGQAESQDLSPFPPPLKAPHCSRCVCRQGGVVRLQAGVTVLAGRIPFHRRACRGWRNVEPKWTLV